MCVTGEHRQRNPVVGHHQRDAEPPDVCEAVIAERYRPQVIDHLKLLYAKREALRRDLRDAAEDDDHVRVALFSTLYLRAVHHYQGVLGLLESFDGGPSTVNALECEAANLATGEVITALRHANWDPERTLYSADVHRVRSSIFQDEDSGGGAFVEAGSR